MLRIPLFVGCHEAPDVPPIQLMWPLGMKAGHALVVTARIGLNYIFNRFFSFFAYGEYIQSWDSGNHANTCYYEYERWRVTGGVRLTY